MAFMGGIKGARLKPGARLPWLDFENCVHVQGTGPPRRKAINESVVRMLGSVGAAISHTPLGEHMSGQLRTSGWAAWKDIADAKDLWPLCR